MNRTSSPLRSLSALALSLTLSAGLAGPAVAQCSTAPDDVFEENDTCATAVPLPGGVHSALHVKDTDPDYYVITLEPSSTFVLTETMDTSGQVSYVAWTPGCAWQFSGTVATELRLSNPYVFQQQLVLIVTHPSGPVSCSDYAVEITYESDPCVGIPDDIYEENDTCATAAPIGAGSYTDLVTLMNDDDYYAVLVPADGRVTVTETQNTGSCYYQWFDDACAVELDNGNSGATYFNFSGQAQTVKLRVSNNFSGSVPSCSQYGFDLTLVTDPCVGQMDDLFEDNDDCASAHLMANGTYPGLFVSISDEDYFQFCVPEGETVSASIDFLHTLGDVDLFLYEINPGVCGHPALFTTLAYSNSNSDNESLTWFNNLSSQPRCGVGRAHG